MENLAPSLCFVRQLVFAIKSQHSIFSATTAYLDQNQSEFAQELQKAWIQIQRGQNWNGHAATNIASRRGLFCLLERAHHGQPILKELELLEREMLRQCEQDLDYWVQGLPFKLMVPLFLLQLPAFLILLFGPLLNEFLGSLA